MRIIPILEDLITAWRLYSRRRQEGSLGAFWRGPGEDLLLEELPLEPDDVVIDAGGFKGEWTDRILSRYGVRITIFEPMPDACAALREKYRFNHRVIIHCAALSDSIGTTNLSLSADGSSIVGSGQSYVAVNTETLADFIVDGNLQKIGVLKLNIEGSEYNVLDDLIVHDLISRIHCILVQFHRVDKDSEHVRLCLVNRLSLTHKCVHSYPFVWERWDLTSGLNSRINALDI